VAYLRDHRGAGRGQVEQALESGIGSLTSPPPELTAFMRSVDQLPAAIDMDRVEQGGRGLRRIGAITITGFGMAAGFATRLRLTHAAIRDRLNQGDSWDTTIYGAPLSQGDTLMAALAFNVIPALAAARLGYRFSRHEEGCLAQFAACAAYRQGVPADLLPVTLDHQRAFIYFMLRTARGNVDPHATHTVMRPLVTANFPGLPAPVQPLARTILHGYGRLFFGDDLCDRTGIPNSIAKHVIPSPGPRSPSSSKSAPTAAPARHWRTGWQATGGTP
jgi:ER-bound oxygenase mpaB/B'/Rubber oxygenase, catalytic domain